MATGVPLTAMQIARIRKLRYEDGLTSTVVADLVGCSGSAVRAHAPGRLGKVPVAPVREIFLASGLSAAEIARRLGWYERDGSGRVKRTLGINGDITRGGRSWRKLVDAETAGLIAEACGRSHWEIEPDEAVDV